jgi:hypothetical protein
LKEFIIIIGDPANAMSRCFFQVWKDFELVIQVKLVQGTTDTKNATQQRRLSALGLAILAGQTELTPKDAEQPLNIWQWPSMTETEKRTKTTYNNDRARGNPIQYQSIEPRTISKEQSKKNINLNEHKIIAQLYVLSKARIDFVTLPVVLGLVTVISNFYNSYVVLGDRDKAYILAFWSLLCVAVILAVASNFYAITDDGGLLEKALNELDLRNRVLFRQTIPN